MNNEMLTDIGADLLIAKAEIETLRKENERLKAENVPVVHGRWIYNEKTGSFDCSECHMSMVRNIYDYCPWCGAKMSI